MAAKLAQAGADVSIVARGPHLAAIQSGGLTLLEEGAAPVTVQVQASADPAALGTQDYVIVTLKAHSVPPVVPAMQPLIGPQTTVVSGVNGVPWWYFHKIGGPLEGTRLHSVDPGDVQWKWHRPGSRSGLRRLSCGRGEPARHRAPYRGEPLFAGRA